MSSGCFTRDLAGCANIYWRPDSGNETSETEFSPWRRQNYSVLSLSQWIGNSRDYLHTRKERKREREREKGREMNLLLWISCQSAVNSGNWCNSKESFYRYHNECHFHPPLSCLFSPPISSTSASPTPPPLSPCSAHPVHGVATALN